MRLSVELNNDAEFRTIKVGNVRTYAVLAPKLLSVDLRLSQASPQEGFGSRGVTAKFPASFGKRCEIVNQLTSLHAATRGNPPTKFVTIDLVEGSATLLSQAQRGPEGSRAREVPWDN